MARSMVLVAAIVATGANAFAEPGRIEVIGDACARGAIEEKLAGRGEASSVRPITIELRRDDAGLVARVSVAADGDARHRELTASTCEELADAVSLVVAMIRAQPASDPVLAPASGPAKWKPAQDGETPGVFARATVAPRSTLAVLVGGAIDDRATAGLTVGLRLQRARFGLALELELEHARRIPVADGHVEVSRGGVSLAPCRRVDGLELCALARLGWTSGRGHDLMQVRSATTPVSAIGAALRWERSVTRSLAVRTSIEVHGMLTRNRFFVDDDVVWSGRPAEGRLGLAMLRSFW